ncbi:alkaline phosphatase [Haloimpatiens sp. FM7315]|uniref:alkaline phosphatase n=1 Tax=Haloimpatiens sp. FM7315 TaxID=3298609 RepID=UPI0039775392
MYSTLAFDDTVKEAVKFYDKHPDETLIVVTADHETGGLTLGFAGTGYSNFYDKLKSQKVSYIALEAKITEYAKSHLIMLNLKI